GNLFLISKDVGSDRWAITLDAATGVALGNVLPGSGGPPLFLWCASASIDLAPAPADTTYNLDCFTAPACTVSPCNTPVWTSTALVGWPTGEKRHITASFFCEPQTSD